MTKSRAIVFALSNCLSFGDKVSLTFGAAFRLLINLLDILGIGLVGAIAFLIGNSPKHFAYKLPLISVSVDFSITDVPLLAVFATGCFLLKTVLSIWSAQWLAKKISKLETHATSLILQNQFLRPQEPSDTSFVKLQNTILNSVNALITGTLTAIITMISEGFLLTTLVVGFFLLNPIASCLVIAYLVIVTTALSLFIFPRVTRFSSDNYLASKNILGSIRDFSLSRREITLARTSQSWIERIVGFKENQITSANMGVFYSNLPRSIIETSLVLGVFMFLGLVMIYSDIQSQSVTIGVFLIGGLRMAAAVLPFQSAITTLRQSAGSVSDAVDGVTRWREKDISKFSTNLVAPTLVANKVRFSSPDGKFLLSVDDLHIPFGTTLALVGKSGSGKSTLVELLLALKSPTGGEVTLGGLPVRGLLDNGLLSAAYVPQRSFLVDGTLLQNVTLSADQLDPEQELHVSKILADCGLEKFLQHDGLHRVLKADSNSLSGGEVQRLGLARALYLRPKILVLDEATSALDAITESEIMKTISSLKGTLTVIIIAHRLSTVANADRIIYLEKGQVIAEGTYPELINLVPDFAESVKLLNS